MMTIDVIVPLYNKAPYVEAAIRSAQHQSSLPARIVIADDGSSDGSAEIAQRLAADDERIVFLPSPTGTPSGPSATRNRAMSVASAEVLAFLDADDWWEPDYLTAVGAAFEDPRIGITKAAITYVGVNGERTPLAQRPVPPPDQQWDAIRLEIYNFVCPSAVAVRNSIARKVDGFDEQISFGEDWDYFSRIAGHAEVASLDSYLVNVRVLPTSSRQLTPVERFAARLSLLDRWAEDLDFVDKAIHHFQIELLHLQLRHLTKPHVLVVELPSRLKGAGTVAKRVYGGAPAYYVGVVGLPIRALARVVSKVWD